MLEKIVMALEEHANQRSTWGRAVLTYSIELIENFSPAEITKLIFLAKERDWDAFEKMLLNGAYDWQQYSYGGCSLIYNKDVDIRLNPPSQRGRCSGEKLLSYQARALKQAYFLLRKAIYNMK